MPESTLKSSDSRMCKTCYTCKTEIKDQDYIISRNCAYHDQCFNCHVCNSNLTNSSVYLKGHNQLVCQLCYADGLDKCDKCNQALFSETYLRANGSKKFHHSCVECVRCGNSLGDIFYENGGQFYCINDYHNQFLFKCDFCHKHAVPNNLTEMINCVIYLENKFHPSCFRCDFCGRSLLTKNDPTVADFFQINCNKSCANCLKGAADERFKHKDPTRKGVKQINPKNEGSHKKQKDTAKLESSTSAKQETSKKKPKPKQK